MNQTEINKLASANQHEARRVLKKSGIAEVWEKAGCRVNLVGSLRMGLLASHRDIDLHVYSRNITEDSSFAIAAKMATNPNVKEIKCINGLHTDEHCMAWHVKYDAGGKIWQFDIIHIEDGSTYDGYFELMADKIAAIATEEQRATILRLKFETPPEADYHGVEYYEAVIADGVSTIEEMAGWVAGHRAQKTGYWMP